MRNIARSPLDLFEPTRYLLRMSSLEQRTTTRLVPEDETTFAAAIARLGVTDPADVAQVRPLLRVRVLQPGEYLLRGGERAIHTGVLVSGLLREHFVTSKGAERTKSFITPLQFTGSLADLLSDRPARAYIVAEAPSRLVLLRFSELRALQTTSPVWAAAGQRSAEHLLMYKAEREYQLLCLDAEARYRDFIARHPDLSSRLAGRHVASYLGITPVHLSRLRARQVGRQRVARAGDARRA
jgi:CRP-like cAMP-binding protein